MENNWKSHRLGDICSLIKRGISPKYVEEGGVCVINQKCIRDQRLSFEQSRRNNSKLRKISDERYLRIGDMLVNSTGVGTLGRVARVKDLPEPTTVDSHVTILRPASKEIDSDYFSWAIRYNQPLFERLGEGSTGQTELSRKRVEDVVISAPSNITEQKAIAHILGSLDDKIELNRRMNETLEAMAQVLFKSWFVDFDPVVDNALAAGNEIPEELKERADIREALGDARKPLPEEMQNLFPSEFEHTEEMGWIPKGWRVGCLEDMVVLQRGFDLPKKTRTDGIYPLIAASGQDGTHNEAKVLGPGVVTGRSGKLGVVTFVQDDFWPLNTTLWVKEYKKSSPYHTFLLLRTLGFERYNAGSAVPTLNRNHIHGMKLVVPSKRAVDQFSMFVQSYFNKHFYNMNYSKELSKLRDTLLPQLLSGEIRIPEAEKLVADLERNGGSNGKS